MKPSSRHTTSQTCFLLLLVVLLPASALADTAHLPRPAEPFKSRRVNGPVLGYLLDPETHGLRPILGIPGAATIGEPLLPAFSMVQVSPLQDYALASTLEDGRVVLADLRGADGGPVALQAVPGLAAAPHKIVLSPSGSAAVTYQRSPHRLQWISGLPGEKLTLQETDLSGLPDTTVALTVSDDATAVLLSVRSGTSDALYLVTPDRQPRPLASGHFTSGRFLKNRRDALVIETEKSEVLLLRDVTGAATVLLLAGASNGVSSPIELETSLDCKRAFLLSTATQSLGILDLETGELKQLPCAQRCTGIARLAGNAVFRLSDLSGGPLQLLEDGPNPRMLFVPVALKAGEPARRALPEREQSPRVHIPEGRQ